MILGKGIFESQINDVEALLRKIGLFGERYVNPPYSKFSMSYVRGLRYYEIWKHCIESNFYDLMLNDNSILQFRRWSENGQLKLSYSYYECPYKALTYGEFLAAEFGEEGSLTEVDFRQEYETYLTTVDLKEQTTPYRYDYSPDTYDPGKHPASHMHIGHSNNVRLATEKVMRPISFVLFILRQSYPDLWAKCFDLDEFGILTKNIREELSIVPKEYFNAKDGKELIMK